MANVSVIVVDQGIQGEGIKANVAFVLGLTAGRELPNETFGPDAVDGDGQTHRSLTRVGHFVRKAGQSKIRTLRQKLAAEPEIKLVDYTEAAAPSDYEQYVSALKNQTGLDISYRAIWAYGPEEILVPLTKNLSRLS